jgi:hypothetical protein
VSPNRTSARLSTAADERREIEILRAWYGDSVQIGERDEDFAAADRLVVGDGIRDCAEAKDRYEYDLAFMELKGYKVSETKLQRIVNRANAQNARPVFIFRTKDKVLVRLDPVRVLEKAGRDDEFQRKRGASKRLDMPEVAVVAFRDLWEEVRAPVRKARVGESMVELLARLCVSCNQQHPPKTTCAPSPGQWDQQPLWVTRGRARQKPLASGGRGG